MVVLLRGEVCAHQFKLVWFVHVHAGFGVIPNDGAAFDANTFGSAFDQSIERELACG